MEVSIEDYAYAENREIAEVQIPEGTKQIGKHACISRRKL